MSWWSTANDPSASTGERVRAGALCGLMPLVCAAQHGAERTQEAASDAVQNARDTVNGTLGGGGLSDVIRESGEAAARPIASMADVLMWAAVILGGLVFLILLGLVWWYVLLPWANGGAS